MVNLRVLVMRKDSCEVTNQCVAVSRLTHSNMRYKMHEFMCYGYAQRELRSDNQCVVVMQVNTLKEELRTAQARASNAEEALSQVGNHDLSNHDSGVMTFCLFVECCSFVECSSLSLPWILCNILEYTRRRC
jgi:hypothetical protein